MKYEKSINVIFESLDNYVERLGTKKFIKNSLDKNLKIISNC